MNVTIWIDADSCPKLVKNHVAKMAGLLQLDAFFVANKNIPFENANSKTKMIICDACPQAADDYIVQNAKENDMVITRDIPLADRLVQKQITVLNDRGTVWTKENIKERMSIRSFSLDLDALGLSGPKANSYSSKEFAGFANSFDKEIHRLIRCSRTDSSK
ncbi:MAG: DUF188 domain-containing protein [Treponema sp.]|nr:DUF188 domain-containing protein [Treponema sp.]